MANLLKEEIPQIYAVCGNGPRSTLAVLRPGLAVAELATAPLPAAPQVGAEGGGGGLRKGIFMDGQQSIRPVGEH